MNDLDAVFKALADPSRRKLLDLLRDGPKTTGALCEAFDYSRYGVMKHLGVLEEAKLITIRRKGRERWNYLNVVPIQSLHEHYVKPYEALWLSHLNNLKQYVETEEETVLQTESSLSLDIAQDIPIAMSPERVFTALTQEISNWWNPEYLNKNAVGLVLEAEIGGRFYELWKGENAGRLLGNVSLIKPNEQLEITGRLHFGVSIGVMNFELEPQGKTTLLRFSHKAMGDISSDMEVAFGKGWQALLTSLKSYVETQDLKELL